MTIRTEVNEFPIEVQKLAADMAVAVNGGVWDIDFREAQKIGWCLKIEWAIKNKELFTF